jgi:hypothetical protein
MYGQGYTIASFCKKSNKFEDLWELSNNSKKKFLSYKMILTEVQWKQIMKDPPN